MGRLEEMGAAGREGEDVDQHLSAGVRAVVAAQEPTDLKGDPELLPYVVQVIGTFGGIKNSAFVHGCGVLKRGMGSSDPHARHVFLSALPDPAFFTTQSIRTCAAPARVPLDR